jgi:hypothetical protein
MMAKQDPRIIRVTTVRGRIGIFHSGLRISQAGKNYDEYALDRWTQAI